MVAPGMSHFTACTFKVLMLHYFTSVLDVA